MDLLTLFGFASVSLMLVFYPIEDWNHWRVLAFAGTSVCASVYGFLRGAWPFGAVEAICGVIALRRWPSRLEAEVRPKPAPAGANAS